LKERRYISAKKRGKIRNEEEEKQKGKAQLPAQRFIWAKKAFAFVWGKKKTTLARERKQRRKKETKKGMGK